jgi:hypothetical protein
VQFVNKKNVTVLQVRQQGGKIAGPRENRPRRHAKTRAHLARHNAGERGFAEPRRSREEQVVRALVSRARGTEHYLQMPHKVTLADEVAERLGSKGHLGTTLLFVSVSRDHVVAQLI